MPPIKRTRCYFSFANHPSLRIPIGRIVDITVEKQTLLKLVSSQSAFEEFSRSVEWHDGDILETHYVNKEGGANYSTFRVLVASNYKDRLEIVFYEPDYIYGFCCSMSLGSNPKAVIQRRLVDISFCENVGVKAACMAYRVLNTSELEAGSYFHRNPAYDDEFKLIAPYDIDWPTLMDLASTTK